MGEDFSCDHGNEHCPRCHDLRYDETCWWCGKELLPGPTEPAVVVGNSPVHYRCKTKAAKYWSDTM